MHRVDTDGHIKNRFFDGDATGPTPIPATVLGADWLNAIQEEISHVIESHTQLDKKDNHQLLRAIEALGFDYVCREGTDLERILTKHQVAGLRIKVLVDQVFAAPVLIDKIDVSIECRKNVMITLKTGDHVFKITAEFFSCVHAVIKGFSQHAFEFDIGSGIQAAEIRMNKVHGKLFSAEPPHLLNTSARV